MSTTEETQLTEIDRLREFWAQVPLTDEERVELERTFAAAVSGPRITKTHCEDCGKPLEPDNKTGIHTACIFGRL